MSDGSVSELLGRASWREAVSPGDARSGSSFERVTLDGQRYFLKRLSPASDWIMRAIGDHVHRPYLVWRAGIMDQLPACIDHAVVAMEVSGEGDDAELSVLMRDVGAHPDRRSVVGQEVMHDVRVECLPDDFNITALAAVEGARRTTATWSLSGSIGVPSRQTVTVHRP